MRSNISIGGEEANHSLATPLTATLLSSQLYIFVTNKLENYKIIG